MSPTETERKINPEYSNPKSNENSESSTEASEKAELRENLKGDGAESSEQTQINELSKNLKDSEVEESQNEKGENKDQIELLKNTVSELGVDMNTDEGRTKVLNHWLLEHNTHKAGDSGYYAELQQSIFKLSQKDS